MLYGYSPKITVISRDCYLGREDTPSGNAVKTGVERGESKFFRAFQAVVRVPRYALSHGRILKIPPHLLSYAPFLRNNAGASISAPLATESGEAGSLSLPSP